MHEKAAQQIFEFLDSVYTAGFTMWRRGRRQAAQKQRL
jgi:hypothetical protein